MNNPILSIEFIKLHGFSSICFLDGIIDNNLEIPGMFPVTTDVTRCQIRAVVAIGSHLAGERAESRAKYLMCGRLPVLLVLSLLSTSFFSFPLPARLHESILGLRAVDLLTTRLGHVPANGRAHIR